MEDNKIKNSSVIFNTTKLVAIITVVVVLISVFSYGVIKVVPSILNSFKGNGNPDVVDQTVKVVSEESVIVDVVEKSMDAVVSVAVSRLELQEGKGVVDASDKIGTGFVVDESGLIVTNQHVVSDPNETYKIVTSQGKSYEVDNFVIDDVNDIAILKVKTNGDKLKTLALGDSSNLKAGQLVIAIGTPLGQYAGSVTTGVISGLNRSVATSSGSFWSRTSKQYDDVIQTDAAINPGNSGGPLLNSAGQVIGVNFATTSGADNISFALPVDRVKMRLDEYRKYGKFIRPYLGVEFRMITKLDEQYYENVKAGALIVRVTGDSPASKGGIKKGDIITKFGGKDVDTALTSLISQQKVGDEVTLEVYREGKTVTLKIKLEEAK